MDKTNNPPNDTKNAKNMSNAISNAGGRINELTPPVGTSFFSFQSVTWLNNQWIGWTDQFGTITWRADIYTYATNANPKEPYFKEKGGRIIIVIVHSGFMKVKDNHDADMWNDLFFQVIPDKSALVPSLQDPATESGEASGDNYKYTIDYAQTMQMFKNQGNEPTTVNAKYQETFTYVKAKQYGSSTDNIDFGVRTAGSSSEHRSTAIHGLSVFTHDNPSMFPVTYATQFYFKPSGWAIWATHQLSLGF